MSGKRRKYTLEFREQAARLVIETGRPVAHVAAEIGVGEQLLGRWVRLQRRVVSAGDTGAVLDADERAELERLRRENAELRLDREFLKKVSLLRLRTQPVEAYRVIEAEKATYSIKRMCGLLEVSHARATTNGVNPVTADPPRPSGAAPSYTPRSPSSMPPLTACMGRHASWPTYAPTGSGCRGKRWRPRCAARAWPGSARAGSRRSPRWSTWTPRYPKTW